MSKVFGDALLITVIGMGLVFAALILLSLFMSLLVWMFSDNDRKKRKSEVVVADEAPTEEPAVLVDLPKQAAVAAVACELKRVGAIAPIDLSKKAAAAAVVLAMILQTSPAASTFGVPVELSGALTPWQMVRRTAQLSKKIKGTSR